MTITDQPSRHAVEASIGIAARPEKVFGYVTDVRREPEWNPQLREAEKLTPGPIGAGTRYRVRFGRGVGTAMIENTAFDPPRSWTAVSTSQGLDLQKNYMANVSTVGQDKTPSPGAPTTRAATSWRSLTRSRRNRRVTTSCGTGITTTAASPMRRPTSWRSRPRLQLRRPGHRARLFLVRVPGGCRRNAITGLTKGKRI